MWVHERIIHTKNINRKFSTKCEAPFIIWAYGCYVTHISTPQYTAQSALMWNTIIIITVTWDRPRLHLYINTHPPPSDLRFSTANFEYFTSDENDIYIEHIYIWRDTAQTEYLKYFHLSYLFILSTRLYERIQRTCALQFYTFKRTIYLASTSTMLPHPNQQRAIIMKYV